MVEGYLRLLIGKVLSPLILSHKHRVHVGDHTSGCEILHDVVALLLLIVVLRGFGPLIGRLIVVAHLRRVAFAPMRWKRRGVILIWVA